MGRGIDLPPVRKRASYGDIEGDSLAFALFRDRIAGEIPPLEAYDESPRARGDGGTLKAADAPPTWADVGALQGLYAEVKAIYDTWKAGPDDTARDGSTDRTDDERDEGRNEAERPQADSPAPLSSEPEQPEQPEQPGQPDQASDESYP